MLKEIVLNKLLSVVNNMVMKHIFPKTKLRYQYKKELEHVVDGFKNHLDDNFQCSLIYLIDKASQSYQQKSNETAKINLHVQLEKVRMLKEHFTFLKTMTIIISPEDISELFGEFNNILFTIHDIYKEFVNSLDEEYINILKQGAIPTFKRTYEKTINNLEHLYQKASKELKEFKRFKQTTFQALPER